MANTVINLVDLDFNKYKETLRNYAKEQPLFKDYSFDGSNMSVLNDILAYNTYHNAFYLNMLFSEMFLDSAQLRNSIVSHTKDLNYLPRSFRSAKAVVDISVVTDSSTTSVTIPKNQSFSTRVNSKTYQFVTAENIVITDPVETVFTARGVEIYEGTYVVDTFYSNYAIERQRFVLSNPTIDTTSLTVVVSDESTSKTYRLATSFLDLDSQSEVFFLQAAENDKYEIVFGNGVIGKRPKNGATIYAEYRVCNGELPNGAFEFSNDRNIGTFGDVTITTQFDSEGQVRRASGGSVYESLDDVRFNAPRHYQTQERAITPEDYRLMLKKQFSEINALAVYGGEVLDPPQYGRVFIATDLIGFDGIPDYKKEEYRKWLRNRMPMTIDPVFIDPTFTWGRLDVTTRYDQNRTDLTTADVATRVTNTILEYSNTNYNDFNSTVRFSNLVTAMDETHPSILSTEAEFSLYKTITPQINIPDNYTLDFSFALKRTLPRVLNVHPTNYDTVVTSSQFIFDGKPCFLQDDNNGSVRIVTISSGRTFSLVRNVGTVDYSKGLIKLSSFSVQKYSGDAIKIYVTPESNDVDFGRSDYFEIKIEDVKVNVLGVRKS
jgi:hypothetical protein